MATHALLRRLAHNGGLDSFAVTVIGEESRYCYDRVNLTECFSGKSADELLLSPKDWYDKQGINLITSERVISIDRANHLVTTDSGKNLSYNRLVLATGSKPFVPPIQGVDLSGVFVYRTIEDIEHIKEYAKECKTAAVLGGGLLGLEAAKALYDIHLETHVVEVAAALMPRQLNTEAAEVLKQEVEEMGVEVHLLRRAEKLIENGHGKEIHFAGHDSLHSDMVVISAGIRPQDDLGKSSRLAIGQRGGIAVDSMMNTADPRISAIGECVSFENRLFGLVAPCYEMAEVVADNLAANALGKQPSSEFKGIQKSSRLKLMGVDVSTLGTPISEAPAAKVVNYTGEGFSRTLLTERNRVTGAIGVGDWPERERLSGLIADKKRVSGRQLRRFEKTGSLWSDAQGASVVEWPASATVCSCLGITKGELTDAMLAGAADGTALAEATGASTVCGGCRSLVCKLAGSPEESTSRTGSRVLLSTSVIATAAAIALVFATPFPFAESVQSNWTKVDFLWKDSLAKQISGYTLMGISLAALMLSLRKRIVWFRLGNFNFWRGMHGLLGLTTLVGFVVHTGMRMGHNFTFVLAAVFLLLNLLGAFTGVVASLESKLTGTWGKRFREWRPKLTQLHIWLFWPIPALIIFHIISVYYY